MRHEDPDRAGSATIQPHLRAKRITLWSVASALAAVFAERPARRSWCSTSATSSTVSEAIRRGPSAGDRRARHLERLNVDEHDWQELVADPRTLDEAVAALEALRTLASLPERQRSDLTLKVAGYSYEEIRALTPGRTFTNVNKSLVKARARVRRTRDARR